MSGESHIHIWQRHSHTPSPRNLWYSNPSLRFDQSVMIISYGTWDWKPITLALFSVRSLSIVPIIYVYAMCVSKCYTWRMLNMETLCFSHIASAMISLKYASITSNVDNLSNHGRLNFNSVKKWVPVETKAATSGPREDPVWDFLLHPLCLEEEE